MTYKTEIKREVNGEILKEPTKVIQFKDGYYSTEDESKIAFIKKHSEYGLKIFAVEEQSKEKPVATPAEMKIIEQANKQAKRMGRPKKVVDA